MKTKRQFFSLALAALVLGACSDDLGVNNGQPQGGVGAGETGYVSLAINLPTQPSTRANTPFDDGDAVEYNVNDATLLIFVGADEANATFNNAYDLSANPSYDLDNDNITSEYSFVQEVTRPATGDDDHIYALVVVNKAGALSSSAGSDGTTTWKVGDNITLTSSTKFSDMQKALTLSVATIANRTGSGNFLMCNAPLYNHPGGGSNPAGQSNPASVVQTLVEIDPTRIYDNENDARDNAAASIYVERAVAKVTVAQSSQLNTDNLPTNVSGASIVGWTLDVTNKKTFLVHNVMETECNNWWGYTSAELSGKDYRFVGSNKMETGVNLYRTYWGIDPNYDGTNSDGVAYANNGTVVDNQTEFSMLAGKAPAADALGSLGEDQPQYCLENTFDVANMNDSQTTRAIIGVKLSVEDNDNDNDAAPSDGSFFTLNGVNSTFYSLSTLLTYVKDAYLADETVQSSLTDEETGLQADQEIVESDIFVSFAKGGTISTTDGSMGTLEGGTVTINEIYIKPIAASKFKGESPSVPATIASNNKTVTDALNKSITIAYYKGGIAYYDVLIKHFGDTQTPWTLDNQQTASYPNTDGNAERNWLGRYGVLRNNWYALTVNAIRNIGSADIESPSGKPDDPIESWMSVEINILSWAVRTQDVAL